MEQGIIGVFEDGLSNVVKIVKGRVTTTEIKVVNDRLENDYEAKKNLLLRYQMRSIKKLDEDEVILVTYLRLQDNALRSASRHLNAMEDLTVDILARMVETHFYNILTSNDIKSRIVSFVITKGFWLHAILDKKDEDLNTECFKQELNILAKKNGRLLLDVLGGFGRLQSIYQKVKTLEWVEQMELEIETDEEDDDGGDPPIELIELVCSECFTRDCMKCGLGVMRKQIFGMYPNEKKSIARNDDSSVLHIPEDLTAEEKIKKVGEIGGSFSWAQSGHWKAVSKDGKDIAFGPNAEIVKFSGDNKTKELIRQYIK